MLSDSDLIKTVILPIFKELANNKYRRSRELTLLSMVQSDPQKT